MKFVPILFAAAALFLAGTGGGLAASSDWHHGEGGSIRLVADDAPDGDGVLRAALEIKLKPGWKTYWRDPGDAGVPPSLDVTVAGEPARVEIGFPSPERFDDGYSVWAGYDEPVSLALTIHLPEGSEGAPVTASAFLGVCETICIPVQARFTLQPGSGTQADAMAVAAAFAALPDPAREGFRARMTELTDETMVVEVTVPDDVEVEDLFVAGTETLALGAPRETAAGTTIDFSLPVLRRGEAEGKLIHYTLVTSAGAVAGTWKQR